jgi:hypothetical protein
VSLHHISGEPIYTCGIIEFFQQAIPAEHHLFNIVASHGASKYLQPLVRSVDWQRWKQTPGKTGNPEEPAFIEDMGEIVREFTPQEVIALGRHTDHDMTVRSLRYLLRSLDTEFSGFLNDVDNALESWRERLIESGDVADVAYQKITSDRMHYANARQAVLRSAVTKARETLWL